MSRGFQWNLVHAKGRQRLLELIIYLLLTDQPLVIQGGAHTMYKIF